MAVMVSVAAVLRRDGNMQLPLIHSDNIDLNKLAARWKSILDPIIAAPMLEVSILKSIPLSNGVTVINHKLGRNQSGWFLVDKQQAGDVYRTAPFNDTTLTLTATSAMVVSIGVF